MQTCVSEIAISSPATVQRQAGSCGFAANEAPTLCARGDECSISAPPSAARGAEYVSSAPAPAGIHSRVALVGKRSAATQVVCTQLHDVCVQCGDSRQADTRLCHVPVQTDAWSLWLGRSDASTQAVDILACDDDSKTCRLGRCCSSLHRRQLATSVPEWPEERRCGVVNRRCQPEAPFGCVGSCPLRGLTTHALVPGSQG